MNRVAILALALVLALAGTGAAAAYFSDTETHAMEFNAGEINLQLSHSSDGGWQVDNEDPALTWSIGPDWAPGDVTDSTTFARNAGTTGGQVYGFKVNAGDYSGDGEVLHNTYITDWLFDWGGRITQTSIWGDWCVDLWDGNDDGNVSLAEFMNSPYGPVIYLDYGGDGDILPPGGVDVEETTIEFTFNPDAGNDLMNKTATVDFTFRLFDDWSGVTHVGEVSPESYGYVDMG